MKSMIGEEHKTQNSTSSAQLDGHYRKCVTMSHVNDKILELLQA
jgi:hypothetical protein